MGAIHEAHRSLPVTEKDFNEIVANKVRERMDAPMGFDFLQHDGLLYEDYALDSLDVMELVLEFESIYRIRFNDKDLGKLRRPSDIWAMFL